MISQLRLKFGHGPGSSPETINATPLTVFVGPNNSGKSKVLSEIEQYCREGGTTAGYVILDHLEFIEFSAQKIDETLPRIGRTPNANESVPPDHLIVGGRGGRFHVSPTQLRAALGNPNNRPGDFCRFYLADATVFLDGKNRINLVNQQPAGDFQQPAVTSLQVLFKDNAKRAEVRRITADAFGTYFTVDPTMSGTLRIRLSDRPPANEREERGFDDAALRFHGAAPMIDEFSDGVKAFTGIITEIIAGDPRVIIIDEPEAFLHPSLAAKLGLEISRSLANTDKRAFVSTHSPEFVMGCIQSGVALNIVRLTYRSGKATARILQSDELVKLMRNPLLRSTGVLRGLFYEFIALSEADADRAFYQEINERLLALKPEWGIPSCLFINAQGKHAIHTVMKPLRQLGIPTAAIVDIDGLQEGGKNWVNLLTGAHVPGITRKALANSRAEVWAQLSASGQEPKTEGGLSLLTGEALEAAEGLVKQMAEYGVFIVPGGELESWLAHLHCNGHGPAWLIKVFEAMGDDPAGVQYERPTDGDVWKFMATVQRWLMAPDRRGIPS